MASSSCCDEVKAEAPVSLPIPVGRHATTTTTTKATTAITADLHNNSLLVCGRAKLDSGRNAARWLTDRRPRQRAI